MIRGYEIIMTEDGSHTVRLKNSEITFHSGRGAIQESQHVFISAGFQYYIQHKTKKEISVFEVGFGTGLNVLLTAIVASRSDKQVVYYAVDEYPLPMEIYANLNYASILNEEELYKIIEDRKEKMPKESYVASLFREGKDRIIQKVGEESTEVIIAAKNEGKKRIISEVADLIFHILVMLSSFGVKFEEVLEELAKRDLKK